MRSFMAFYLICFIFTFVLIIFFVWLQLLAALNITCKLILFILTLSDVFFKFLITVAVTAQLWLLPAMGISKAKKAQLWLLELGIPKAKKAQLWLCLRWGYQKTKKAGIKGLVYLEPFNKLTRQVQSKVKQNCKSTSYDYIRNVFDKS